VKQAEAIIHSFHPKPGRLVSAEEIQYVVPDIFIKQVGDEFVVQLNDDGVPRKLRVSKLYQKLMQQGPNNR
jgi:RNA polymerase sigma-54 factor